MILKIRNPGDNVVPPDMVMSRRFPFESGAFSYMRK